MPNPKLMTFDELKATGTGVALMPYHIPVFVPRDVYHRFFDVLARELDAVAVGCNDDWKQVMSSDNRVMFAPGRMPDLVVGGTRARKWKSAPYVYQRDFTRMVRELERPLIGFSLSEDDIRHVLEMC